MCELEIYSLHVLTWGLAIRELAQVALGLTVAVGILDSLELVGYSTQEDQPPSVGMRANFGD